MAGAQRGAPRRLYARAEPVQNPTLPEPGDDRGGPRPARPRPFHGHSNHQPRDRVQKPKQRTKPTSGKPSARRREATRTDKPEKGRRARQGVSMSKERLYLFDTTLRDGAQTNGVVLSVEVIVLL